MYRLDGLDPRPDSMEDFAILKKELPVNLLKDSEKREVDGELLCSELTTDGARVDAR